ncbi:M4 family metallopeptidase [Providencia alcalifaciens]
MSIWHAVIMREEDKVAPTVPAHRVFAAIGLIRSFLKEKLNIDQMFGCDADINAVIHYDKNYSNAFWNSQAIFFGDGDGTVFGPFYNDIDIIAHELAHGYISSQADFDYVDQSGALNESVADVLGIMAKQYVLKQTATQSNWLLGENLFIDKRKGPALRSMKEPGTAYYFTKSNNDPQVGHMDQYRDLPRYVDNGGVHINSGIPNKAFYLLATKLGGYSWEIAGKIWVAAVSDPSVSNTATFIEFAQATIRSAKKLFGDQIELATRQSWLDVGLQVQ